MTLIVNQLETFDKKNLEIIRLEFLKLQRKLEECQEETGYFKPDIGELPDWLLLSADKMNTSTEATFFFSVGNCNHTGIVSVSKPTLIHINAHLKAEYQYGGWGKDSKPVRGHESMFWYGAYSDPSVFEFYLYSSYDKLIQRSSFTHHGLPQGYEGSGNNYIVHGNAVYFQASNPFRMSKLNLTSSVYSHRQMTKASETYSYVYSPKQYLDFSADEKGLWVLYSTEEAGGKIVVAKIDEKSFAFEDEQITEAFKPLMGNAFMACGVMYATRPGDLNTEEIYYSYDTQTGEEKQMSVSFQKFQDGFVNLHYNPTDQKLYMYNKGYYASYNVKFGKK